MDAGMLKTISDSVTSNITLILPIAGGLFALMFGIKLVPKLIAKFTK